ncbi:PP2C multi-domain protein [Pyrenophora tritici-repentis]|nr:PP2C multi-domain protein [Pyrenophora tritici-repentis]
MSDSLEPPAKRARLEADAPTQYGAFASALDAPGSPVDDMDDDFYDTTPVKVDALPAAVGNTTTSSMFAAAAPAPAFHLPGLGSVSDAPAAQPPPQKRERAVTPDEAPEDGELSDDGDAFYDDAQSSKPAAEMPVEPVAANQAQAQHQAPQDGISTSANAPDTNADADEGVPITTDTPAADTDGELDAALTAAIDEQNNQADTQGIDSKADFLRAAEANKGDENAEWQLDSDASDSDDSSDSSSSDDSSSDEGELLDPAEQVRLLMAEAADEPGATGPVKVKTLNEVDEQYEKPDIIVTEATKITELGTVESIVQNLVVVKAHQSGDERVLESGSALCLQDRVVVGKVSEQIGRVEEPRYSFGFNDAAELVTLGIQKGTPIYYVDEHSTFTETEPIRRQKHTDASNLHDEETNDVEFSDDEKEAEYKREQKAKKRARADGDDEPPAVHIPTGPRLHVDAPAPPIYRPMEYQGGGLKYSDDEDEDLGMYKPLARPDHFEQIVGQGAPLEDRSHVRRGMGRGRGPWGDRGRGFRGRGAGGRGDFGGGGRGDRGGFGGARGDFSGGRGDRGAQQNNRGGHGNNRGDKGGGDKGRGGKNQNQNDRGRQQDQFNQQQNNQRNGPYQDNRSGASASPARQQQERAQSYTQQDRGQSQQAQAQQSPAGGGKNKNRKQRQRWPVPFSTPAQPAVPYAAAPHPLPPTAATSYPPQPSYTPQPQAPAQPPQQQTQAANWAAAEKESEISPGTVPPAPPPKDASHRPRRPPNWDGPTTTSFGDHRKQLAVLETSGNRVPSISRNPPTASSANSHMAPWSTTNGGAMANSVWSSFFNDSNEDLAQPSPGFRPQSGSREDSMGFPLKDDRRPSVASATTVSSTGSKSSISRGFHKKLQNIFGDDFPADGRQHSDTSLPYAPDAQSQRPMRNRGNSLNNTIGSSHQSRPVSPTNSRPRTPQASSEVTPWEFQDSKEFPTPGEYGGRRSSEQHSAKSGRSHHKLHVRLPGTTGHRHRSSKEENKAPDSRSDISQSYTLRPTTSRDDVPQNPRPNQPSALSSAFTSKTSLLGRPSSPTPSSFSDMPREDRIAQRSPSTSKPSHGFFARLRGKDKEKSDRVAPNDNLKSLSSVGTASTTSLNPSISTARSARVEPSPQAVAMAKRQPSTNGVDERLPAKARAPHHRLPTFRKDKRAPANEPTGRDPNDNIASTAGNDAVFFLDSNLDDMEGIVNLQQQPPMTPPVGELLKQPTVGEEIAAPGPEDDGTAAWDAPDSWAVKRMKDEMDKVRDVEDTGTPSKEESDSKTYCLRIFRVDSTFATLSATLNTTVQEIIQILGKKTVLQDELDNYHIVMRKHDTSRQLENNERPLLIQKRLLELAGYTDMDRLEDVGREDNSYLCRFTFLPAKMSGYSSLERDPGFSKMQKFSHIDLQGRNLITIPITLYQKATEIISLNLSRNLSLDVPRDFILACTNLREIKYTSNDARRLPPSLSLASRLTMLDISNNRLQSLDRAELYKLQSLQGLRLSNNGLTRLPPYFGQYRALRSLNLSSNSLHEFPDFLCEVRTLVDLDISFNSISSLPRIGQLTCLERLWATNNKLTGSFPPTLSNLVNLREIDVRFNALDSMDVMSQLPRLEYLMIGHNSISAFEGYFPKIRVLHMNHNPVTRFGLTQPTPSLSVLNLASAKLAQLPEDLFGKLTGLTKLILDKNHFTSISNNVGKLYRLEHLSIARNSLDVLPAEIGRLVELKYLDVRENNLAVLPQELWYARRLETLNVSSNVLDAFPKPGTAPPQVANGEQAQVDGPTPGLTSSPSYEELGKLEDFQNRRPSQASGGLSVGTSPAPSNRKGSMASYNTTSTVRKPSVASRAPTEGTVTPMSRKDSSLSSRLVTTFAGSLRHVFLADNRLTDDVFDELCLLPELRIVNLAYNLIYDVPPRTIRRWQHLTELYLSGNDLTSLPSEDLEEVGSLKVLHINNNKFQVLPAELGKVAQLAVLDVASNSLKYNVSNWPYDWNWNWNHKLRYLNLSGNKRLEIKPSGSYSGSGVNMREGRDLTDFSSLINLRVLGLMDVTMMVPSVPEQSEDRRVRTAGSAVGTMAYGMADSLGRNEHISTMDMVVPRFRSHDDEQLLGLFDAQPLAGGGSKIAKYLYDHFKNRFADELERLRPQETPSDALRRTYLGLNKELATAANQGIDKNAFTAPTQPRSSVPELGDDDLTSGSVATVLFLKEMELYISNVGDAQALLIRSEGGHKILTRKHDPAEPSERSRIREAGGFVSRQGKLNDILEVSRAFGYVQMSPSVIASPHILNLTLGDTDEMVLVASRELWEYLTPDFAVDVARSERNDLMRAAQKLRDLAIAFGATNKIMVMLLGVSDLKSKQRARYRTQSMSLVPAPGADPDWGASRRRGKKGNLVGDSKLARLDNEVDAPTGEVSLVFTDIKNSTILWETYPIAMRSAIKMHNELMRRQLRIIGGYEVKTEGDAFMVAFRTVTSALLWCFTIQSQLLEVQWPQEILNSVNGQEVVDPDGNVIFRGLSVRMGIHWGTPVCEVDPVTKRMDYFGPMVNRASRISSVADGGQITVSSDFIAEIQRLLETHIEGDRNNSAGSEEAYGDDMNSQMIRGELRSLSSQGFEVKDLGERRLKGLENPEYIYLMYPHSLASRLAVQRQTEQKPAEQKTEAIVGQKMAGSQLTIDTEDVWDLWNISLRLEMLCSSLESPGCVELKPPETALLERMKSRGGEITDRFLINFVEHQISRIESCANTLALRHMIRPFGAAPLLQQACHMGDIFTELEAKLKRLEEFERGAMEGMAPS